MPHSVTRRAFLSGSTAIGLTSVLCRPTWAMANDEIGLAIIGCGSRGKALAKFFSAVDGVRLVAACDPDERRRGELQEKYDVPGSHADMRKLLEDRSVDVVAIATCNHWHALAAIWAMQAGKDVYVEKPLAHNPWEGEQVIAAAERYDRICQVGTHQRSDELQSEIQRLLHEEKALGEIQYVRANRYGIREPIGLREKPLEVDSAVDYDLWLGPAKSQPLYRDQLHYDWHWDWNTGSGEMGNWGVHILDDVRFNVFQDKVRFPKRIVAGGGRVAWQDGGNTPNVHLAYFDADGIPVVLELSNLAAKPGSDQRPAHVGPSSGYVVHCTGGRLEGQRESYAAYDSDGKRIKQLETKGGNFHHQRNFIDAVRARDKTLLNGPLEQGFYSTSWCDLANIACRAGAAWDNEQSQETIEVLQSPLWKASLENMQALLEAHGTSFADADIRVSGVLEFDENQRRFLGANANPANDAWKREYRNGYEVPQVAETVTS